MLGIHRYSRVALLILFLSWPAWAADEDLAPDGDDDTAMSGLGSTVEDSGCSNACSGGGTNCYSFLDEDPDGAADDAITVSDASGASEQVVVTFPTPTNPPSQSANAQRFHILASKCLDTSCLEDSGGSGTPALYVYLWCNGTMYNGPELGNAICAIADISGEDQSVTCDWTLPTPDCATDGSDVEVGLGVTQEGGGPNERWSCHEAVEWEVTWASTARRILVVD